MERERKKSLTIAENLLQLIEMKQKGRTSTYCRHSKKKEMEKEEKKIIIIIIIMRTTIIINPGQRTRSGLTKSRHEYEYTKKKLIIYVGASAQGRGSTTTIRKIPFPDLPFLCSSTEASQETKI
jgi:hypothetical protein